jgi:hypothetical protein
MTSSSNCEQSRRFYLQVTTKLWSHQKVCLKHDTRSVTVRFKARVQQYECTFSLWDLVTKRLTFKFTYPFTFPIKNSQIATVTVSIRVLATSVLFSHAASREALNRISTNLLPEILLTFGTGNFTDIYNRKLY